MAVPIGEQGKGVGHTSVVRVTVLPPPPHAEIPESTEFVVDWAIAPDDRRDLPQAV